MNHLHVPFPGGSRHIHKLDRGSLGLWGSCWWKAIVKAQVGGVVSGALSLVVGGCTPSSPALLHSLLRGDPLTSSYSSSPSSQELKDGRRRSRGLRRQKQAQPGSALAEFWGTLSKEA